MMKKFFDMIYYSILFKLTLYSLLSIEDVLNRYFFSVRFIPAEVYHVMFTVIQLAVAIISAAVDWAGKSSQWIAIL